jgi:hypothetical protein
MGEIVVSISVQWYPSFKSRRQETGHSPVLGAKLAQIMTKCGTQRIVSCSFRGWKWFSVSILFEKATGPDWPNGCNAQ